MTPYVLELVEKWRAGELPDAGFRVVQDAAHEVGCRLRALRGRTVNIKKSNRPTKDPLRERVISEGHRWIGAQQTKQSRRIASAAIDRHLQTPTQVAAALLEWMEDAHAPQWRERAARERDEAFRGRQMTIRQDGPMFFEFAPARPRPMLVNQHDYVAMHDALARQDRADAEALATTINAPPRMLRPPEGFTYLGMDALSPENGFTFMGREWDSERIFRELKRDAMFVGDGYVIGRPLSAPIVLTTTRNTPAMFVRRHLKRAPDPRAKPSRVPEKLQRQRLDGRRSR
jgi:hypothetical protein